MQRVIGMDIHRTFAEVVFWEAGRLRPAGRIDMTRSGLEGFGRSLSKEDEVVVEATGNAMAVVRVLSRYVARVIVANPLQVKAIAHAHVKTDKIDAGVLASLRAAGFLPEVWLPDAETELRRRLWLAATKSFGIAPRSRTGCIPFFRRILSRRAHTPTYSAGWVGTGSDDRNCQPMSGPQSTGICASSIG
jgi:hypothetical protein